MSPAVDSAFGRFMQRLAGSPSFAKVAPHIVPRVDRIVHRLSGGRLVLSSGMLPIMVLTTTGAKSGQRRTTPLATLPQKDGTFLVVGSNFGREHHPAWTANLLAHPAATVSFKGNERPVDAHLLTEEEKAEVWPLLTAMWPTFDRYVERSGRDLRVFRLSPR